MKKIIVLLLVGYVFLFCCACQSKPPASQPASRPQRERKYVSLENKYTPNSTVCFDTNSFEFEFEDADGKIGYRNPWSSEKEFSGQIDVTYYGPIGEEEVNDEFRVPYSDSYQFRMDSEKLYFMAICGRSYVSFSGEKTKHVGWTINTMEVNQEGAAEFLFLQGEDKDFPGTGRFCVTVKLSSAARLEASWVEGQIRILNPGCEFLLQISDTQDMKQTEEIPLTVTGECFDLYTDGLADGLCSYEDDAGLHEITLEWSDME